MADFKENAYTYTVSIIKAKKNNRYIMTKNTRAIDFSKKIEYNISINI